MAANPPFDLAVVDRLLSTTRAVRKRLDLKRAVEPQVILDCLRLAQQAPTASNSQGWRFVVVTDATKRKQLAEIYARSRPNIEQSAAQVPEGDAQTRRVYDGALWLADHIHEVPVHVVPCVIGRPPERFDSMLSATIYGSIIQAVWSFQLALRSRGLGSLYTSIHLAHEGDARRLLGIPDDVLQAGLIPVAYTTGGDFRPAARPPVETVTFWNQWGEEPES